MLIAARAVRGIAKEIANAANGAFKAYLEDRAMEEPQITDRIIGAVEERINNRRIGNVSWKALTLRTGRGNAAQEKRHGADLMGVLDVDLPDYKTKKGFIAQMKKAEPRCQFSKSGWERLCLQCEKMLDRTPDSFVFVYSKQEKIRIFPANSILGLKSRDIFDLYSSGISSFFENHIKCFIGDSRLNSPQIKTLDALVDFPVRRVLQFSARP